jgi:DME family drug/metabolite transporter
MLWFLLALAATVLYSVVNISDKVLVNRYLKNPLLGTIVCDITMIPVVGIAFLVSPPKILKIDEFLMVLTATLFGIAGVLLYFKAMRKAEASRLVVALQSLPLFVLVLAVIFLGETLSYAQIFGIISIVVAAILASDGKLGKNKWVLAAFLCSLLWAMEAIVTKYLLGSVDYWSLFLWSSLMALSIYAIALPLYFKELRRTIVAKPKLLAFGFLSAGSYFVAYILELMALSIRYVSLVSAVSALQPFIVLVLAAMVSKFAPSLFREAIDRKSVTIKVVGALLASFGVILLL